MGRVEAEYAISKAVAVLDLHNLARFGWIFSAFLVIEKRGRKTAGVDVRGTRLVQDRRFDDDIDFFALVELQGEIASPAGLSLTRRHKPVKVPCIGLEGGVELERTTSVRLQLGATAKGIDGILAKTAASALVTDAAAPFERTIAAVTAHFAIFPAAYEGNVVLYAARRYD